MRIPAFVVTSLVTALFVPAALAQQGVAIASGGALTDFTTWTLAGSATAVNTTPGNGFTYSQLALTQTGAGGQAGSGFAPAALGMDFNQPFFFDFNFFIPTSSNLRGDGMTFTLAAAPGLGNAGSGLGYEGINNSVAFAIDTFHFGGEPVSPSLQILTRGSTTPLAATPTGLGDNIRDPNFQWYASVSYVPSGNNDDMGVLTGRIVHINLGTFEVASSVDFNALGLVGSPLFYGFTASNGLAMDGHAVTSAVPVPEPGTWALMALGLMAVAGRTWRLRMD